jgi:hypothetical protein
VLCLYITDFILNTQDHKGKRVATAKKKGQTKQSMFSSKVPIWDTQEQTRHRRKEQKFNKMRETKYHKLDSHNYHYSTVMLANLSFSCSAWGELRYKACKVSIFIPHLSNSHLLARSSTNMRVYIHNGYLKSIFSPGNLIS